MSQVMGKMLRVERLLRTTSATGAWLESHPDLAADVGQACAGLSEPDVSCLNLIMASWGGGLPEDRPAHGLIKSVKAYAGVDMDLVEYVCVGRVDSPYGQATAVGMAAAAGSARTFPATLMGQLGPGLPGLHEALASDLLGGLSGSVAMDVRRVAGCAYVQSSLGEPLGRMAEGLGVAFKALGDSLGPISEALRHVALHVALQAAEMERVMHETMGRLDLAVGTVEAAVGGGYASSDRTVEYLSRLKR